MSTTPLPLAIKSILSKRWQKPPRDCGNDDWVTGIHCEIELMRIYE